MGAARGLGPEMLFTSLDVADVTDVTLRQLQWWDEQGVVTPLQKGHRRLYNLFEVLQVSVIMSLRQKGISLQRIRRLLRELNRERVLGLLDGQGHGADLYLLTDGDSVYLETVPEKIVALIAQSDRPVTALCVSDLVRKMRATLLPKKPVQTTSRLEPAKRSRKVS